MSAVCTAFVKKFGGGFAGFFPKLEKKIAFLVARNVKESQDPHRCFLQLIPKISFNKFNVWTGCRATSCLSNGLRARSSLPLLLLPDVDGCGSAQRILAVPLMPQ
jgi:hypothetical protein